MNPLLLMLLLTLGKKAGAKGSGPRYPGPAHAPRSAPLPPKPQDVVVHATDPSHPSAVPPVHHGAKNVSAREVQGIAIALGAKLLPDGKCGPKTRAAWTELAERNGLDGAISCLSLQTATVVAPTYEALKSKAGPLKGKLPVHLTVPRIP